MTKTKTPWPHQNILIASLRLKGKFTDGDIDMAAGELMEKGYIEPCENEEHGVKCWQIVAPTS
jgi:hypothetical protein